jgi:iron(III) transport system ATP-binding protein
MVVIDVRGISKRYSQTVAVKSCDLQVSSGEILALLGPSGSGKTTVLRLIAGFERPDAGRILIGGRTVVDAADSAWVPPEDRGVGMVFQDYALFPHLTVSQNIRFGLRNGAKADRTARVAELLALTELASCAERYPHELSGGQQQRVALARALAPRPELLLLDEPFSNLDIDLRERLSLEVRDIIKASAATAVLVTHDQQEAFAMADEIGVLHEGRIQQWDSPYNLYHRPANRFVADFVGQGVFLPAKALSAEQVEIELGVLMGGGLPRNGEGLEVLLRPDDVVHDDAAPTRAEVLHKAFRGAEILYTLRLASGRKVLALVPSHHNHALGEKIGIRLDVDHVVAFRPESYSSKP